ncbi:MAG TPA: hypothetical protein VGI66_13255 [Streptosporangiaceae bacterium]
MTVMPGQQGTAGVEDIPDPDVQDSTLLVQGMAVGICGRGASLARGAPRAVVGGHPGTPDAPGNAEPRRPWNA